MLRRFNYSVAFSPFFCSQDLDYREMVVVETRMCGEPQRQRLRGGNQSNFRDCSWPRLGLGVVTTLAMHDKYGPDKQTGVPAWYPRTT